MPFHQRLTKLHEVGLMKTTQAFYIAICAEYRHRFDVGTALGLEAQGILEALSRSRRPGLQEMQRFHFCHLPARQRAEPTRLMFRQ